jgi:membrane protease YdiL (CAAX protease family)
MKELAAVFISPVTEEIFFRGLVFGKFLENHRLSIANLLQSLLFTAMHCPNWIWVQGLTSNLVILSVSIFALALLLGWVTFYSNSIWPAIGIHILNNFIVAFLG